METVIFEYAKAQGWTQGEFARRIGYSREHIVKLSTGTLPITEQFRDRCIARLGPWAAFMFREKEPVAK